MPYLGIVQGLKPAPNCDACNLERSQSDAVVLKIKTYKLKSLHLFWLINSLSISNNFEIQGNRPLKVADNARMNYGERLQDALNRAGRTRKQLAAAMGVSTQAVGMVINGVGGIERKLSAVNNEKAAAYLGISRLWLLTGENEPNQQPQKIAGVGLDALIELLPKNDYLLRAQVFAQASQLIITAVVDSRKTQAQLAGNQAEKQS